MRNSDATSSWDEAKLLMTYIETAEKQAIRPAAFRLRVRRLLRSPGNGRKEGGWNQESCPGKHAGEWSFGLKTSWQGGDESAEVPGAEAHVDVPGGGVSDWNDVTAVTIQPRRLCLDFIKLQSYYIFILDVIWLIRRDPDRFW